MVALLASCLPVKAGLIFNVTFDPSVGSAPSGFVSDFNTAIGIYESLYTNPITINMNVGWGEIDGGSLNPGDLGQSLTNQPALYTYSQVKGALVANANNPTTLSAVATLPATDPTGGSGFAMSNGEAKALGLLPGNQSGTDGWVGFDSTASWTFDPVNRAVSGKFDFLGVALHEIAEVMGRYGMGQNGYAAGLIYSPIDLYRFTSNGVYDTFPENGDYFSINSGLTNLNTYNGTGGGDLSDWSGLTSDAFNASLNRDTQESFSSTDVTLMDVLGYQQAAVPEPSTLLLLAGGLAALILTRRRHAS